MPFLAQGGASGARSVPLCASLASGILRGGQIEETTSPIVGLHLGVLSYLLRANSQTRPTEDGESTLRNRATSGTQVG